MRKRHVRKRHKDLRVPLPPPLLPQQPPQPISTPPPLLHRYPNYPYHHSMTQPPFRRPQNRASPSSLSRSRALPRLAITSPQLHTHLMTVSALAKGPRRQGRGDSDCIKFY
ncbi:hypothetical protein K469DRAFT_130828 [Zopfia rhizophila CBS 207.26]|uniref:Uncharacterized protein n=1 Tax=Zopfia rhizophila CBS 207.26 TaxID=1314779 RepID=A0A6A6EUE5_9PEZI|nr:hypothetical protein K469DRAFT_130828 [Zopfia rhizophila CBS 207.26]